MKLRKEDIGETLDRGLGLFRKPSRELMDSVRERTAAKLELESGDSFQFAVEEQRPIRRAPWRAVVAVAAVIAIAVLIPLAMLHRAPAIFQDAAGSRKIQFGEVVHASDSSGSTLALADTSRVEMRARSELSLERADDGVRIQLRSGDVIVNAAKQHGHLYVQTNDVTVSVVGTVFLVKAEAEGSRVAVIQGEVHVQQGSTDTSLMPGEQVMTKSQMEWKPVSEEISWSRQAGEHVALLQQSTAPVSQGKPRLSFAVATVKPVDPASMRGGHEGHQLDRERFVDRTELLQYIVRAYLGPSSCVMTATPPMGQICPMIAGTLPAWVRTDRFEIQARMPPDSVPSYTSRQARALDTPELNLMLQGLLEDRFLLKVHWEVRELPVYRLTIANNGPKLNQTPAEGQRRRDSEGNFLEVHGLTGVSTIPTLDGIQRTQLDFLGSSMKETAKTLAMYFDRPVLDGTGLKGDYDFSIEYEDEPTARIPFNPFSGLTLSALSAALQPIGLKVESTKAPVDVLVIDNVEKPSEN